VKIHGIRPIEIGHFSLSHTAMNVTGHPSFAEYQGVGDFIRQTHQASGWWLVDWITYGETRPDWREQLDDAIDAGVLKERTVKQYRYVGKRFPASNRIDGVDFAHHVVVARLAPDQQRRWLETARTEGWSKSELQVNLSASERTRVISGQAVLDGMYRVIYADPPWPYRDKGPTTDGSLGKAERHYPTMSMNDICNLPVKAHALRDSILFLWVPAPMLLVNPGPRDVIEAWGFEYKSQAVWDKVLGNFGHYFRVRHENLLVCTRGSCLPDVPTPMTDSVITIRRSDEHSEKPEDVRKIIAKHWTVGPFLELFARKKTPGWSCFGNDSRLWAEDAKASV
jgi:N6-adenosine-specific RNA methylase IME4